MSDTTENTVENTEEQGVEKMSIDDVINFAETGVKPVAETTESQTTETETQEEEQVEEPKVEDKTTEKEDKTEEAKEEVEETIEATKDVEESDLEVDKQEAKDPYEDIFDEDDKAYFNFKKNNPGTTRADYEDSKIDYSKLSRKELLRKSLREKYNLTDNDAELDEYIETELGIPMDTDESEMSVTERVRLRKHTDEYVQAKQELHNKWAENQKDGNVAQPKEQPKETVTLEDGTTMPKEDYIKIVKARETYVKNNEEALNRVKETSFTFSVDDNGEKRELKYSYEFDKNDKHRMLSITTDAVKHFNETYQTENGVNHEDLNINKAWEDPNIRSKMLASFAQAIRAEAIEESLKDQGNVTIGSKKPINQPDEKGVKYVPISELLNN